MKVLRIELTSKRLLPIKNSHSVYLVYQVSEEISGGRPIEIRKRLTFSNSYITELNYAQLLSTAHECDLVDTSVICKSHA